jgi:hypothetical protein
MRSSELRGLTWDDVDLDRGVIHVRQRADQWGEIGAPKSATGHRTIAMGPELIKELKEWKLRCPKYGKTEDQPGRLWFVFPNGAGKPESHANIINRRFNPVQILAGVCKPERDKNAWPLRDDEGKPVMAAKYGLHALRHFFASTAIEGQFQPKEVQTMLGHASIQMTFDVDGHLFHNQQDDHARIAAMEAALRRLIAPRGPLATCCDMAGEGVISGAFPGPFLSQACRNHVAAGQSGYLQVSDFTRGFRRKSATCKRPSRGAARASKCLSLLGFSMVAAGGFEPPTKGL